MLRQDEWIGRERRGRYFQENRTVAELLDFMGPFWGGKGQGVEGQREIRAENPGKEGTQNGVSSLGSISFRILVEANSS